VSIVRKGFMEVLLVVSHIFLSICFKSQGPCLLALKKWVTVNLQAKKTSSNKKKISDIKGLRTKHKAARFIEFLENHSKQNIFFS